MFHLQKVKRPHHCGEERETHRTETHTNRNVYERKKIKMPKELESHYSASYEYA